MPDLIRHPDISFLDTAGKRGLCFLPRREKFYFEGGVFSKSFKSKVTTLRPKEMATAPVKRSGAPIIFPFTDFGLEPKSVICPAGSFNGLALW
jgi:hypothetical protein